ncbi:CAP domain-containing protein [Aquimarina sediminis]|uniref:CAP domain-containing protein n=1 Tax=Aquimarina sediminis TaxID=2070536 RepID=UPI000CA05DAD|nr:CAP domain-containing protein [Aquimarina sediminis]
MKKLNLLAVILLVTIVVSCSRNDNDYDPNVIKDENTELLEKNSVTYSSEELKLYELIMEYRRENGLKSIPLSNSLSFVAQSHARDLVENKPDISEDCNAHSWSNNGNWSACCYTWDHAQASCMWNKPREMTSYTGYGFEIAAGSSNPIYDGYIMTADYALQSWQGSSHHNDVILNGAWWNSDWNAIGIGMYGGFATAWFGHAHDQ